MRVTVVGAGVVGLTVAAELAAAGRAVTVVADRTAAESVSAVAAAIWFPYRSETSPAALGWLEQTRLRLEELALDPATGVDLKAGTVVERASGADRSWTAAVGAHREATPDELPSGALAGVRVTVPVLTMPAYLPWLLGRCTALGVRVRHQAVRTLADLHDADLVVVAAGLRSRELLADDGLFPIRGQVVRLPNPGLRDWLTDEDHPGGLTYVVPRRDDVVCGGTAQVGSWDPDPDPDPDVEAAVLARCTELVPALAGLPVLSRAVGLRPGRATVRLEPVPGHPLPVIACYGHGGAGVSMSWGCAAAVRALVDAVLGWT